MNDQQNANQILMEFQKLCINFATGTNIEFKDYEEARNRVMAVPLLLRRLPDWVSEARYASQFWTLMKKTSNHYAPRRKFINDSLSPVFEYIEKSGTEPISISFEEVLRNCDSRVIEELWQKIHTRRGTDPEGTITASRSLVESTCKFILESTGTEYEANADLPTLYKLTAKKLTLGPNQHKEDIFKQILSGCHSIVNGLAGLRNEFGDAHGKNDKTPLPLDYHADLAVNAAGTIATFLISTYEKQKQVN